MTEAKTLTAELDDVAMMGKAIDQGSAKERVCHQFSPAIKGEIGREQEAAAKITLRAELEQQLRTAGVEGEEAEFVQDHEVDAAQGGQELG